MTCMRCGGVDIICVTINIETGEMAPAWCRTCDRSIEVTPPFLGIVAVRQEDDFEIVYVCKKCDFETLRSWKHYSAECPSCGGLVVSKGSFLVETRSEWTWCNTCGRPLINGKHVNEECVDKKKPPAA